MKLFGFFLSYIINAITKNNSIIIPLNVAKGVKILSGFFDVRILYIWCIVNFERKIKYTIENMDARKIGIF